MKQMLDYNQWTAKKDPLTQVPTEYNTCKASQLVKLTESRYLILTPNNKIWKIKFQNTLNMTCTRTAQYHHHAFETRECPISIKPRWCKWTRQVRIPRTTKDTGTKKRTKSSQSWSTSMELRTGRRLHSTFHIGLMYSACTGGRRSWTRWWLRVHGAVRKMLSLRKTFRSLELRTGAILPKLFQGELESSVASGGTITWIQQSRKTSGQKKRTGPSLKLTRNMATSGLKLRSLSPGELTITLKTDSTQLWKEKWRFWTKTSRFKIKFPWKIIWIT